MELLLQPFGFFKTPAGDNNNELVLETVDREELLRKRKECIP